MKTETFILSITFSHLGPKSEIESVLGTTDFVVEVDEFEGTDEEHHSGSVNYPIVVNEGERAVSVLNRFIKEKDLIGECFSFSTQSGIEILTEDEYNSIEFYD